MQLIESINYASGVEGRISTTKNAREKGTGHVARIVRTFELCVRNDGLYSV